MVQSKVWEEIENDEFFANFLESKDKPETNLSFAEQIKKLSDGLDLISAELKQKIRQDYPKLIQNSSQAGKLMVALESLTVHMTQLQNSVDQLKKQVYGPYYQLENQIKILERLHNSTMLLRKVSRFLQLHQKLQNTTDLQKQAIILFELDFLVQDKDLMKIEIISEERTSVISSKQRLLHIANRDLTNGIQNNNEQAITKSLEIYRNLEMLETFLKNQTETYINDISQSIKQCFAGADLATLQKTSIKVTETTTLKTQSKGPGKVQTLTTSLNFRTKLLVGIEWLFTDELFSYCEQALAIQRCLKKVTSGFIGDSPAREFLNNFSKSLSELLKNSFQDSQPHVLQNLQQNLPKLLASFNTLREKLSKEMEISKTIFSSLTSGYIEKCAGNLKISLSPTSDNITEDILDVMVKNATSELCVAQIDDDLCLSVIDVLCACNKDFWSKIKANIKLGTDAQQVIGIPNSVQIANINSANLIFHHSSAIEQMMVTLDLEKVNRNAFKRVKNNLSDGRSIIVSILSQLTQQMSSAINIILLSMHREPSINTNNITVTAPSLYMRELQEFLNRSWTSHMSPFNDKIAVAQCAKDLSTKFIDVFVQNLSVLRPISLKGRQRMKSDCSQLETVIQMILSDLSTLGNSYRLLRSIAVLIVEPPEKLIASETTVIPSYIILFLLFGYADADLLSPHKAAGWSDEKLIQWLAEHKSERERLELINGALQKYRTIIRKKNMSQYDPVYPLISTLLEKSMEKYSVAVGLL
ncbi:unnamed protein product [Diamesa hyperborea]